MSKDSKLAELAARLKESAEKANPGGPHWNDIRNQENAQRSRRPPAERKQEASDAAAWLLAAWETLRKQGAGQANCLQTV